MRYFVRTIALVVVLALELLLVWYNYTTLFVGLLIGPACMMLTVSGFAIHFFRQIEKEPGAVRNSEEQKDDM